MNNIALFFILTFLAKIILGIVIPLASDEAYYWVWAHHLQLSFFDHPPMVSWLFYLGIPFEGFLSAPRIPGVILGHVTLLIWFKLVSPFISQDKQKWLLWALLLTPLTGLGSLIITPDLPLLFFWSLSIFIFMKTLRDKKTSDAVFLGAAIGLGFCSKYHMVLFFPLALLYLYVWRKESRLPIKIYVLVALSFLIFSTPVLYWNYVNNFVSFKFQLNHGLGQSRFNPYWSLKFLFDQFLLVFPPIVYLAWRRPKRRDLDWLYYFGWGPICFFLITSLKGRAEANWALVGIPALISLAIINSNSSLKLIKASVMSWAVVFLILLGLIFSPTEKFNSSISKLREIKELRSLLTLSNDYTPLFTSTYQMASLMTYYSHQPIYKLQGVGRTDFFDFLSMSRPQGKRFYWLSPSASYLPAWAKNYSLQLVFPHPVATDTYLFEAVSP